ncbi:hypothetical protein Pint_07699 [Pistacia integerrima]|uniref:Uncharacterized protein n=1 Tax=Pistacia integerrima TaxID=434235 RepID=A0ACC0XW31_9ROSI|nr:hypothetical protein Pint_07699 [Pistacia integerrima]
MSDDPSNGELKLTSNRQGTGEIPEEIADYGNLTLIQQFSRGMDVTKQLNPCLWKGINCSGGSLITQLSLSGFGLFDSEFLSVVCNISSLQSLDVSENQFSSIPDEFITDCGRIGSIPHRIVKLAKLEVLILSVKMLDGGIPANFSSISTLSRLAANQNNFTGSIPSGLTRYVKNLDLSYNKLTGSIPEDFLSFTNLQTLDLSYNSPEGSIPDKMSPSLVRLRLGGNSLNGVIPSANNSLLEKLTYLELANNSFRIGNMNSLIELQLGEHKLSGRIPTLPVKLQVALNLSSNQLGYTSGPILLLDLSSKNIMLRSLKEPHLGDIEPCKVIDPSKRTSSLSTLAGSIGYIPQGVTTAGNVYGFRVILLQLLTRKPPISEGNELAKLVLPNWKHEDINISATSLAIKKQMLAILELLLLVLVSYQKEGQRRMLSQFISPSSILK